MAGDASGTAHENPPHPGVASRPAPLALYRKYRPATFAEVKGQDHVTEPLRQALRSGRVHHAYLFSGPRGCGKTSSARILARSLNCEQGPTPEPCGVCASCLALAPAGPGSIDVIEIDAASHGGVDDARDLRERAFYAPVSSRFKIYIIDEAHMVTGGGFNALLKLVEEPPPHLKFVFATTEPEKVIPTIRSRTHHYPFRLVPPAVLRELLEEILSAEGVTYAPSVLPLVVRAGAGSVRDSLSVLDQLLAGAGPEGLTYERTVALLGYTDDRLLDEVVDAFAAGEGAAVFAAVDRVVEGGHDPRRFTTDLLDRFRDLIILAAVPGAGRSGLLNAPDDRLERMAEQAHRFGQADLTRTAEILSAGLIQMRGTTSPRLLLELMCAQVLLPGAHGDEKALLARVERLERRWEGTASAPETVPDGPATPPREPPRSAPPRRPAPGAAASGRGRSPSRTEATAPTEPAARAEPKSHAEPAVPEGRAAAPAGGPVPNGPPSPPPAGPVDADVLRQRWPEILEAVKSERRVAWMLLNSATVHSLDGNVLTISFSKEGEARGFSSSGHDQVLVRVLGALLGRHVQVRAVTGIPQPQATRARPAPQGAGNTAGNPRTPESGRPGAATPRSESGGDSAATAGRRAAPGEDTVEGGTQGPTPAPPPGMARPGNERWPEEAAEAAAPGGGEADGLMGMDLIKRQLGGQIIAEIDDS